MLYFNPKKDHYNKGGVKMFLFFPPLSKLEEEEIKERAARRLKLSLPPKARPLIVRGIPTHKYQINVRFWEGFHLNESLVVAELFLEDEGHGDIISVEDYMQYAKIGVPQMKNLVSNALPALTFYDSSEDKSSVYLKLSDIKPMKLKKLLAGKRELLRGMGDGSIIICENGNYYIQASDIVGKVPSVTTSHVTYPNASYRETDYGYETTDPGEPVVVYGETGGRKGYPIRFTLHKTPKEKRRLLKDRTLLWAIQFENIKGEV